MDSVSVIIPTYKRGESLRATLPSYLKQKHVKEIIIVDDGGYALSDIQSIISTNKNLIKYFSPQTRLGVPAARNFGISKASGSLIMFGEDDVELSSGYIDTLMKNMEIEGADIIAGRQIFVYKNEIKEIAAARAAAYTEKDFYISYPIDINFSLKLGKNISIHALPPCALFKKAVFSKVRYDEAYSGNYHREETDLVVSALEHGFQAFLCSGALAWHLNFLSFSSGGTRMSGRIRLELSLLRNNWYFWKKHHIYLKKRLFLKAPWPFYVFRYMSDRYYSQLKKGLR